ncbi:MAG: glycosyltransferase [Muribaculaceae bacterium]|nr:glycosyltransferase [Muribaculaceae bacterium]
MTFNLHIPVLTYILLGTCVALALIFCLYYILPLFRLGRWRRHCNEEAAPLDPDATAASASIVVYSRDDVHGLERLIPELLGQDYEGDYEVVVVNEGESAEVRDYIDSLQMAHRNLYLTHTPDGARNLSRKKLALTLGIKAARGEVVVLTTATSIVKSNRWLAEMMRPFNNDAAIELVTGVAIPVEGEDCARGRRRRSFDFIADCATWLTAALRHHPYRGMEQNIAYRRELFFNNKGFSRSLNIQHGDDDIFVNEIARADNTAVQLSDESIVRFDGDIFNITYGEDAARRAFTGRHIRRGARRRMAVGSLAIWLWIIAAAATVYADPTNWLTAGTVAVTGLAILTMTFLGWRSAMKSLNGRSLLLTLPWLVMTRPFRKFYYRLRSRKGHNLTYL